MIASRERETHSRQVARRMQAVRLSHREIQVMELVAAGHRSQDVADVLFLSKRTVDFHLANCFEKLGVCNRIQAVRTIWSLGILPFEPPFLSAGRD